MKTTFHLILLLACLILQAQHFGSIKGKIQNPNGPVAFTSEISLVENQTLTAKSNPDGTFLISKIPTGTFSVLIKTKGYEDELIKQVVVNSNATTDVGTIALRIRAVLDSSKITLAAPVNTAGAVTTTRQDYKITHSKIAKEKSKPMLYTGSVTRGDMPEEEYNTESYSNIKENEFLAAKENPLSTFSIDVDGASYSNSRRYLEDGSLPPADAVRVEEFINYFSYDYAAPTGQHPFAINTEMASCPWNKTNKLILVNLKGKSIPFQELPAMNITFLIDVSGSMSSANKLPLLKKSLGLLVDKLRSNDKISIVVYAGAAGLVLEPTNNKQDIMSALDRLEAGGSTAGGDGIKLAYKINKQHFIENGNNRIILATDGDFNIGASSDGEMTRLIEEKREQGIYITVLGFGMGNYKDSKMETIADHGNGNYFYIDNFDEARKVLVTQLDGTLYTIAKDVKLQLEFNPAKVAAYRLVGYENRMLKKEDFNNDKKDAGELGAGHTVTALYEIVPAGNPVPQTGVDELKYQKTVPVTKTSNELLTVKFRYKEPKDTVSKLIIQTMNDNSKSFESASENLRFASSAAGFGMLLRDSKFKGDLTYSKLLSMAQASRGKDEEGYRAELVKLVKTAQSLSIDLSKK